LLPDLCRELFKARIPELGIPKIGS
jgi:hypothetical protein